MNKINENCFLALSLHNNKVFLTIDHCSLTLGNFILTLENLGSRVNDSWDSDPSENPGDDPKRFTLNIYEACIMNGFTIYSHQ